MAPNSGLVCPYRGIVAPNSGNVALNSGLFVLELDLGGMFVPLLMDCLSIFLEVLRFFLGQ